MNDNKEIVIHTYILPAMRITRQQSLVDLWVQMIRAGQFPPGHRLPTHRSFAQQHGVALVTASKVYAQLERMGLVVGEVGRGTFVRERAFEAQEAAEGRDSLSRERSPTDLAFCYPRTPDGGVLLQQGLQAVMAQHGADALMLAQPVAGHPLAREAIRRHLQSSDWSVPVEQILLATGAQQGLACAVLTLLQPGDLVVVDALTYPGFTGLAQHHALDLQPLPWSAQGPDLDALEELLKRRPVKAIFCMPTLHNPTGWVMDLPARQHLASLAQRHKVWLIEDSTYAFLVDAAPPTLASLAPDRTVHVSSLSKSVGAGLRQGYVILPPALIQRAMRVMRAIAWSQPTLPALLTALWIDNGTVLRLEVEKRRDAREKQILATRCLEGLTLERHPESFFVWVHLPEDVRPEPVTVRLADQGIAVAPASAFAVSSHVPRAIRLNLAAHSLQELAPALKAIQQTISDIELA